MENNNPFSLKDKLILVTGASSGIGKQCALTCFELGAKVIITGRNEKRLNEIKNLLGISKEQAFFLDLTEYDKVNNTVEEVNQRYGKLDGIIHSAGVSTTLPLKLSNPEKLNELFNINVASAFNLTKTAVSKKYFNSSGSIIFISSVMGVVGEVGKTIYSTTKGALIAGAKSMSLELAKRGIRVNTVSPGVVESPMSANAFYSRSQESTDKIIELHPLGLGKPEDVSYLCTFLLSDASRWITGTNIVIDGGYTAR